MKLVFHYILAANIWLILFFLRSVFILVGISVTLVALFFRYQVESTRTGTWTTWQRIRLPSWAWLWDNERDGCLGDIRGDYAYRQSPTWLRSSYYWMAFNWLALRNPANNFSRFSCVIACDTKYATCETLQGDDLVDDKPGLEGYRFVRSIGKYKVPYYGLYWVSKFKVKGRSLVIYIGHKIDLSNNKDWSADPQKAWKGLTFRIGFKEL